MGLQGWSDESFPFKFSTHLLCRRRLARFKFGRKKESVHIKHRYCEDRLEDAPDDDDPAITTIRGPGQTLDCCRFFRCSWHLGTFKLLSSKWPCRNNSSSCSAAFIFLQTAQQNWATFVVSLFLTHESITQQITKKIIAHITLCHFKCTQP